MEQREINRVALTNTHANMHQLIEYTLDVLEERNALRDALNETRQERDNARIALGAVIEAATISDSAADLPDYTRNALDDYRDNRRPVGGFLYAVLSNNLAEAFARADENNRAAMFGIIRYVWNELPRQSWGSPAAVDAWLAG